MRKLLPRKVLTNSKRTTKLEKVREEELRAALRNLLWYVEQLERIVYSSTDTGVHEEVAKAHAALEASERRDGRGS